MCILCQRERPIFMVDSDLTILQLPERTLPPFLKSLKDDFINKRSYLKFLRISSKNIKVCECVHKTCHAYCATAFVLRSQKIYCKDCFGYFHLYVYNERIFSHEYIWGIVRLALILVFAIVIIDCIF